ncbi:RNA polymerase sigma factor [Rubripirellula reticaptiva]|uniref:ECF RNA polymerase sigma factor SigE n=1 Tax=Rubripirellula reticaptiva TaxID=2528013 RepID=A0A5C6FCG0_9BACT|nr:sigma-70 family RNA polymerase sigma factor [Rubripirellula reticaptiva]TWU57994.1 ECF RNA polymerase sigma factor SigE [Rubripirellula reticaptiva]
MSISGREPQPTTRPSLLVRLKDTRDHEAWTDFHAVYEPVIYAMCRRRGLQDADAREIVQEVLMAVSRSIANFTNHGDGTFRGWLSRITRNATIDALRKSASRRETIDASGVMRHLEIIAADNVNDETTEEFDWDRRQQLFRWAAAEVRQRTGETNWIAFWKSSVDGLSISDVAKELGIGEGAVYVARCRIIKRIRELVDDRLTE